jgi:hypothetical protein
MPRLIYKTADASIRPWIPENETELMGVFNQPCKLSGIFKTLIHHKTAVMPSVEHVNCESCLVFGVPRAGIAALCGSPAKSCHSVIEVVSLNGKRAVCDNNS